MWLLSLLFCLPILLWGLLQWFLTWLVLQMRLLFQKFRRAARRPPSCRRRLLSMECPRDFFLHRPWPLRMMLMLCFRVGFFLWYAVSAVTCLWLPFLSYISVCRCTMFLCGRSVTWGSWDSCPRDAHLYQGPSHLHRTCPISQADCPRISERILMPYILTSTTKTKSSHPNCSPSATPSNATNLPIWSSKTSRLLKSPPTIQASISGSTEASVFQKAHLTDISQCIYIENPQSGISHKQSNPHGSTRDREVSHDPPHA